MTLNDLNMGKFNALFARIFVRETHKPPEREVIEKSNTKKVWILWSRENATIMSTLLKNLAWRKSKHDVKIGPNHNLVDIRCSKALITTSLTNPIFSFLIFPFFTLNFRGCVRLRTLLKKFSWNWALAFDAAILVNRRSAVRHFIKMEVRHW